jgi:hypothetical protein
MRSLIATALIAAGAGGLLAQEPKTYESKEGKFSAKFPSPPKVEAKTSGGLTLNMFNADFDKGKGGYLVSYSDLSPELLKAPLPEQVLASSEKGLVDTFKAKVTKSAAAPFGPKKYPAREIAAERDDWNMRCLLILVGDRMYQVSVYGPKDFIAGKDADAFLASFALTQ